MSEIAKDFGTSVLASSGGGVSFVILVFCLLPLAVFGEEPGLTMAGWLQLGVIILSVGWGLFRLVQQKKPSQLIHVGVLYVIATAFSNFAVLVIIPGLLH